MSSVLGFNTELFRSWNAYLLRAYMRVCSRVARVSAKPIPSVFSIITYRPMTSPLKKTRNADQE